MLSLRVVPAVSLLLLLAASSWSWSGCDAALTVLSSFSSQYSVTSLTAPPLPSLRGLAFVFNDTDTLLVGTEAYSLKVLRSADSSEKIIGLGSARQAFGNYTPASYTSLKFAPWKNRQFPPALVYAQFPGNANQNITSYQAGAISQLTSPYTLPNVVTSQLLPIVQSGAATHIVSLAFTPKNYPSPGLLVISNSLGLTAAPMTQIPYTADTKTGTLIYDVAGEVAYPELTEEADDLAYTLTESPLLSQYALFAAEGYHGPLTVYHCDGTGRIVAGSRQVFAEGDGLFSIAFDPVTGDLLASTYDNNVIYLISGFSKP